jgi:hypothetical protein
MIEGTPETAGSGGLFCKRGMAGEQLKDNAAEKRIFGSMPKDPSVHRIDKRYGKRS